MATCLLNLTLIMHVFCLLVCTIVPTSDSSYPHSDQRDLPSPGAYCDVEKPRGTRSIKYAWPSTVFGLGRKGSRGGGRRGSMARSLRIFTTVLVSMSSISFPAYAFVTRPHLRPRSSATLLWQLGSRCPRQNCYKKPKKRAISPVETQVVMLLGVETGAGLLGLGALGALRAFTSGIAPKRVRVVTDIDDTVKSSGNKRILGIPLGGIDAQSLERMRRLDRGNGRGVFPKDARGTFYPGVFQFNLELARHRVPPWQEPLSVAVLTARAREFLFALEIGDSHEISRQFRKCGDGNDLKSWGRGPVLYGSVKEWICASRKSIRKARNFGKLVEDDGMGGRGRPTGVEGGYVFIGDTGEGDPRAGELMSSEYPERLRAVFLHVVSDAARQDRVRVPLDKEVNGVPFVYFRTYVGAAVKAVRLGLIDKTGLNNVIAEAKQALSAVPQTSSKWIDLHRDIALAQDLSGGDISTKPLLPLLPSLTVETLPLSVDSFGSLKIKPTIRGREVAGVRGSEFKYRRRVARRNEQTAEARRKD